MAQPAGQMFGLPARCRVYLASSPVLCAGDTLLSISRIIYSMMFEKVSYTQACKQVHILKTRSDSGYVERTENNSWTRWLCFLIGTLPSVIRLASVSGLPWSKIWGLMFVSSFVINEMIAMSAHFSTSSEKKQIPQWSSTTTKSFVETYHKAECDTTKDNKYSNFLGTQEQIQESSVKIPAPEPVAIAFTSTDHHEDSIFEHHIPPAEWLNRLVSADDRT
ncbi:hypothetical protein GLAREA_12273 [Glarea lozoyensis ATCC 20868]|uniref:Uncharacterized protein n=1 Tax=Glarea lozoyensis (strain ATCC 20868 / MF5171) TaxID=1116229 RepID=S3CZ16_GLAL2|nr:uncharacterized protein GLAREA_12273 [Glarea lozoyensis ATCC 20868]EPE31517.1 hypothetical protein GLAREA_12273 [Glarea lozoyensis ATCC 20868]